MNNDALNIIATLYQECISIDRGSMEPDLLSFWGEDEDAFSISVTTTEGETFSYGDKNKTFPILSIAKAFVYGLIQQDYGPHEVLQKISVEPTGEPHDRVIWREEIQKGIFNPLINAGALIALSMVRGSSLEDKWGRLEKLFERLSNTSTQVHQPYLAHRSTRDSLLKATAYALHHENLLETDVEEVVALFNRQCCIEKNTDALSVMAATLSNSGINPVTGEQVFDAGIVKNLLSVMYMCGLYNFSGQWSYRVGLPAKSGLAGVLMVVVPGQMGIVVYSPRLGQHRKSERGVEFFTQLSERLNYHIFNPSPQPNIPTMIAVDGEEREELASSAEIVSSKSNRDFMRETMESSYHQVLERVGGLIYQSESNLQHVNPNWFGVSICWTDGERADYGDYQVPFLIQSLSKVFTFGMALEDLGRDYVLSRVDVEPTGHSYNSMIRVDERSKRPLNPMVNTGAIAVTSLIRGNTPAHCLRRVLEMYHGYVGHPVFVDMPTYISEQNRGDRNWAIAYLLRSFGMVEANLELTLDLYLQQCSVMVNAHDLATMAATLANRGRNPITGVQAIQSEYVRDLLSVMFTCGMYDYAGQWVYKVGYPAKSGVGGGLIVVVPDQFGLAVFSPLIDQRGNSLRGVQFCETFFQALNLHCFKFEEPEQVPQ